MLKLLIEFIPLIAFFVGYKVDGILTATLYTLIATIGSTVITLLLRQKISKVHLITNALLLVSASLTLFSGNTTFIKMKPTILY
ncbi:MAG: septation protein IspZ, partial [Rickettsiaceae bacterium]|nr:septation protein IspZ [Rickettsiaceae bacterium]